MKAEVRPSVTVMFPGGRLRLEALKGLQKIVEDFSTGVYLTTSQNVRLTDIPIEALEMVRQRVVDLGLDYKKPGQFPLPRVCVGKGNCPYGQRDTQSMSAAICEAFRGRERTKGKFKIAISGCSMCCSGPKTTDIGLVGTNKGYDFYVGGKGGPHPSIARRIGRSLTEEQALEMLARLVAYHDEKTRKKQRFCRLLDLEDFPYPEI